MNRSATLRQKRSLGKTSPLSKRPKLDFSASKSRDSLISTKNTSAGNESFEKPSTDSPKRTKAGESKQNGHGLTEPDWDDDFSGDMLEKVCLIADLSQAMANNQPVPERLENAKVQLFEDKNGRSNSATSGSVESIKARPKTELEELKLELKEIQDRFATKEAEVFILRSQLKQNEDANLAAAFQNMKTIEEMQKKYNAKLGLTEKELDTYKTKLQFKDMEYKTLSERCRQLEYCVSKNKTAEGHGTQMADTIRPLGGFSQMTQAKGPTREPTSDLNVTHIGERTVEFQSEMDIDLLVRHEGKYLESCLCPEVFQSSEEPNVIEHYPLTGKKSKSMLDSRKMDLYKWTDLPKQTIFLKDLYESLSGLFGVENFHRKEIKRRLEDILDTCWKILNHNRDVLIFLEKLQLHHNEHDDSDQYLLENKDEVSLLSLKLLLKGGKLRDDECGIEGRRILALIYALMTTSQVPCDYVKERPETIDVLKSLAETIGNLRRPLRYTGILGGICFVLLRLLQEKNLDRRILITINETVEEIIFARPKLDVLTEVVKVLASGRRHIDFLSRLCRKASLDSCSLYVDSRLRQAMFFTKNACPLKLLCMQIMGLACLASGRSILLDLTQSMIDWLNNSINTADHKSIKWLPTNSLFNEEERCFDVTECLLYLLILCLKDYLSRFPVLSESASGPTTGRDSITVIGHGAILVKRILRADQRMLNDNSYSLRFAILLRSLTLLKSDKRNRLNQLNPCQTEAIRWLAESVESESRNQDCYIKQSTTVIPEADMFNALKIDNESIIY